MKLAVLFAGQGSQKVGMGKDFYETYPEFAGCIDLAGEKIKSMMFDGPMEELSQTKHTQPALVAYAAGIVALLQKEGLEIASTAGLSLGEYSALYLAQAMDLPTLYELCSYRGSIMQEAAKGVTTAMSAIMTPQRELVEEAVEKAKQSGRVEISNYNATGQIVIAGEEAGVAAAEALLKEQGVRKCIRLKVSGPFHTSYMEKASKQLQTYLDSCKFQTPKIKVFSNVTAKPMQTEHEIKELLTKQIKTAVHMEDILKNMKEDGITHVIEVGPGKVLAGFLKRTAPELQVRSIDCVEDYKEALAFLKQERE